VSVRAGRLRGMTGIVVAVALLLGLGGLAFVSESRAVSNSETVHRDDRLQLQTTLSGLTKQYLLLTFGELNTLAHASGWQLTPSSGHDRRRLASYVASSPLITAGAALVTVSGSPLTETATGGLTLPAASDPGYAPLRADLLAGQPGLSNLMTVNSRPLLAFGLPVMRHAAVAAVLIGYVNPRTWPLQQYVSHLQVGTDVEPYILDGTGHIVAGSNVGDLGGRVGGLPTAASPASSARLSRYRSDTTSYVATRDAVGLSGWQAVNVQPAAAYNGSVNRRQAQTELALLAMLLVIGAITIAALFTRHRRVTAAARNALFDPLTGLGQRQLLTVRLEAALARSARNSTTHVGVIYGDLDRFKAVNDTHGHRRGDALLVEVATRLRDATREEDLVARVGGDEFVVIIDDVASLDALRAVTERITTAIEHPVELDRATVQVGISLGAILTRAGTVESILEAADTAMYDAKRGQDRRPVIRELGALAQLPPDYTLAAPRHTTI
jgi:diguanylate cyclase (GGDEF)-like protein